jgi:hypothetical protein
MDFVVSSDRAGGYCRAVLTGINDHHADLGVEEEVALAVPSLILSADQEDYRLHFIVTQGLSR